MQDRTLSRRIPHALIIMMILLGVLASSFAVQNSLVSAQKTSIKPHTVGVAPHYRYAGQIYDRTFRCQSNTAAVRCYGPKQIRTAYSIQPLIDKGITGKGRSIVIVDAFQAPSIREDLAAFNSYFGLPDAPLNIIAPDGLTPFDPNDANQVGWSGEIALDVQWAHAIAPEATINLVLGKSNNDDDLISAVRYAVEHNLGDTISMSFGENETCLDKATLKAWHKVFADATKKNITLFASSGDQGAATPSCEGDGYSLDVSSPAHDPLVTGVGGTQLIADAVTGEYQKEVVWNEPQFEVGTGGGYSKVYSKPFYQYGIPNIGKTRGVPDVAYNGAINGGVLTVWSDGGTPGGVFIFGGTSAGSPQWAGIAALASQYGNKRVGFINPIVSLLFGRVKPIYSQTFHDITEGDNTFTYADADGNPVTIQGYSAQKGWDATTGWGTPIVSKFVPLLSLLSGGSQGQQLKMQSKSLE